MDYPNPNPNHFWRVVHQGSPWTGDQCFVHHGGVHAGTKEGEGPLLLGGY